MKQWHILGLALCSAGVASSTWAQAERGLVLDEVIVTAQKFEQTIQDVPLSITAYSGAALEDKGIGNFGEIQGRVPGLALHQIGNGINIQIRGIGSTAATVGADGTAALNVDGVYRARNFSAANLVFDVARVEVLRGPQGTLYGRNATTGAVNVVSNAPSDKQEAAASIEFGNYSLARTSAMLNLPISNLLKIRVAAQSNKRHGYLSNGDMDADDIAGRLRVLVEPSEQFSVLATADYSHKGGQGAGYTVPAFVEAESGVRTANGTASGFFQANLTNNPWYSQWDPNSVDLTEWGLNFEINTDLGWASLVVQPAYRYFDLSGNGPGSGTPLGTFQDQKIDQGSLEIRLNSAPGAWLNWVAGLYYFDESYKYAELRNERALSNSPTVIAPTAGTCTPTPATGTGLGPNGEDRCRTATVSAPQANSYAAFGQATLPVTESFRVTAGARYTRDERSNNAYGYSYYHFSSDGVDTYVAPFANGIATSIIPGKKTFTHFDWKAGVEFDVTKDILLFANASTGYKAGGLNPVLETAPVSSPRFFDEEEIKEYMGGVKSTLFGNTLIINLQGYYWDYQGRQQVANSTTGPGRTAFINYNLGGAKIYGAELEVQWVPTQFDSVGLQVARNKGKYNDEPANTIVALSTANLRNQEISFSPPWQVVFDYERTFNIGEARLVAGYHGTWRDRRSVETGRRVWQDADLKHDLTLRFDSADRKYSLGAFIRNVTNEDVISSSVTANTNTGVFLAAMEQPRTYGVNLNVKF